VSASFTIDSRGFTAMCADLERNFGEFGMHLEMRDVIMSEGAAVLQTCLSRTKALSKTGMDRVAARFSARAHTFAGAGRAGQGIRQSPNARSVYPRISVAPKVGRTWWLDKADGSRPTFYIMSGGSPNRRWSDKRWAQFQAMEAERLAFEKELLAQLPKLRGSRGTTKQSWVQIADNLGIQLKAVPDYVRKAVPFHGPRVDGVGRKFQNANEFFIELENRNQILIGRMDGAGMLQRAVSGRIKFFETNMAKGAFNDIAKAIKKYPGIAMLGTAQIALAA
jgi:hypothetical protein